MTVPAEEARGGPAKPIGSFFNPHLFPGLQNPPHITPEDDSLEAKVDALAEGREHERSSAEFYSELNLCRYPFASLWDKDTGRTDCKIVVQGSLFGEGQDFRWEVTPHTKHGMPGPFDRKVWRAMEKIFTERSITLGRRLENPQPMPIEDVLRTLRMALNGTATKSVIKALLRLRNAEIDCYAVDPERRKHATRSKRQAKGIIWSPISIIKWAGEVDESACRTFRCTNLWLSDFYLASFNNGNVRPIDWNLWLALKRPIAQRLYEILEVKFFGLQQSPFASFGYKELCSLLPTVPQRYRSQAEQKLGRSHNILRDVVVQERPGRETRRRLLDRVEWIWEGDDAMIRYYPHPEYLAELRERRSRFDRQNPRIDTRAFELAQEFGDLKSTSFYQLILTKVDWELIQVARTETRMAARERRLKKRPAAFFVGALTGVLKKRGLPIPYETASK